MTTIVALKDDKGYIYLAEDSAISGNYVQIHANHRVKTAQINNVLAVGFSGGAALAQRSIEELRKASIGSIEDIRDVLVNTRHNKDFHLENTDCSAIVCYKGKIYRFDGNGYFVEVDFCCIGSGKEVAYGYLEGIGVGSWEKNGIVLALKAAKGAIKAAAKYNASTHYNDDITPIIIGSVDYKIQENKE